MSRGREMWKIAACDMEKCGTLESGEYKNHFPRRGRWWPRTAKREGDKVVSKTFSCNIWKERTEPPNVVEVSLLMSSRNDAPSRKGCVVNGNMTEASNK